MSQSLFSHSHPCIPSESVTVLPAIHVFTVNESLCSQPSMYSQWVSHCAPIANHVLIVSQSPHHPNHTPIRYSTWTSQFHLMYKQYIAIWIDSHFTYLNITYGEMIMVSKHAQSLTLRYMMCLLHLHTRHIQQIIGLTETKHEVWSLHLELITPQL